MMTMEAPNTATEKSTSKANCYSTSSLA